MTSPKLTNLKTSREKVLMTFAVIAILIGSALFFYGEWTVSIGWFGVVHYLLRAVGAAFIGTGVLIIGIWFTIGKVAEFRGKESDARRQIALDAGRQGLTVLLNVLIYGGLFILVMGGLAALDSAGIASVIVVLILWAVCIAGFVAYRRYRKKHKASYAVIGNIGVALVLLLLGAGMFFFGCRDSMSAAQDLRDGPVEADAFLVDARLNNPNWRYRFIVQPNHVLTFYTPDEERIVLEVLDADVDDVKVINDMGNYVHLTYYPHTQIFCDAQLWSEGRQAMGADLMARLDETYDLEIGAPNA